MPRLLWPLAAFALLTPPARPAQPNPVDADGYPLPAGAVARLGEATRRATESAHFAFSPDGRLIARVRATGTDVRETTTGRDVTPPWLCGNTDDGLQFAPTGDVVLHDRDDRRYRVVEFATGKLRFAVRPTDDRNPYWLQVAADGRTAVLFCYARTPNGTKDTRLVFRVTAAGAELLPETGPDGNDHFSLAAGGRLFVCGRGGVVRSYATDTGALVRETKLTPGEGVRYAVVFADGWHAAAVSATRLRLLAVRPDGAEEVANVATPGGVNWPLACDPAAGEVAFVDDESRDVVRVRFATGEVLKRVPPPAGPRGHTTLAPTGRVAVTRFKWGRDVVWDATTGQPLFSYPDLPGLADVRFPDSQTAVTLDAEYRLTWWELRTGRPTRSFELPIEGPRAAARVNLSPDGRRAAVLTGGGRPTVRLFDTDTGRELAVFQGNEGDAGFVPGAGFAPDGRWYALSAGGRAVLADADAGRPLRSLREVAEVAAWSPDGRLIAAAGRDGRLRLVETRTGRVRHEFGWTPRGRPASECPARHLAFSADGRVLVRFGEVIPVTAWALDDEPRLVAETPAGSGVSAVGDVSPDGRFVVYAAGTAALTVLDLQAPHPGTPAGTVRTDQAGVSAVRFAPGGDRLVTASADGTAVVWDWPAVAANLSAAKPAAPPTPDELWAQLGDLDARAAGRAVAALAHSPSAAVALIESKLAPVAVPPADRLRAWVRDLDSDRYAVRAAAEAGLAKAAEAAEAVLRTALDAGPSAEGRSRVEGLLARLDESERDPDRLRAFRAVEVLERAGGPHAVAVLKRLAGGHPDAALTRDAKAALDRLSRR